MGTRNIKSGEIEEILNKELYIEKVISYDADSRFTYFYPRISLPEDYIPICLDRIWTDIDTLLTAFNHVFEVFALNFDDFQTICGIHLRKSLYFSITLRDLIYQVFYEEYLQYIRPLLQLTATWVEVEAPYNKYYFISKLDDYAYRIDSLNKIEVYKIIHSDIDTLYMKKQSSLKQSVKVEKIRIPISKEMRHPRQ